MDACGGSHTCARTASVDGHRGSQLAGSGLQACEPGFVEVRDAGALTLCDGTWKPLSTQDSDSGVEAGKVDPTDKVGMRDKEMCNGLGGRGEHIHAPEVAGGECLQRQGRRLRRVECQIVSTAVEQR